MPVSLTYEKRAQTLVVLDMSATGFTVASDISQSADMAMVSAYNSSALICAGCLQRLHAAIFHLLHLRHRLPHRLAQPS